ncbi:MAG: gliding motility-associated transporter permease subunit GldF [Bacteroidota bacterium]
MIAIVKKELGQFFSGLLGYLTIGIFLLLMGSFVFLFPESNVLDAGYANLDVFFDRAPFILLFLIPAITMKSFSEEFKSGTFEILRTTPLSSVQLVTGKFLAALLLTWIALAFTIVYPFTISYLSTEGIDTGAILASYVGLMLLCAVYVSIGLFTSSLFVNSVVSFLTSALFCFLLYAVFGSIAQIQSLEMGLGYYISLLGIQFHYENMSRGFVHVRDLVYFISVAFFFVYLTVHKVKNR